MNNELEKILIQLHSPHELLSALLFTAQNDWNKAHQIAQKNEGMIDYDRVHALLHRIEGDEFNAKYWYRRINEAYEKHSIEEEWRLLTIEYLKKYN